MARAFLLSRRHIPRFVLVMAALGTTVAQGADDDASKPDFKFADESIRRQLVADDAVVRRLADGFQFTEGPIWLPGDGAGRLVFSDIPADTLFEWSAAGGLGEFRKPSGQANGNCLDREGRLITCEHGTRRVSRTEADGSVTTLAERHDGKRFNKPNDAVVRSDGSIWFTDPDYGYGPENADEKELDANYVFRLDPADGSTAIVAKGWAKPNGICFSPDESVLYVVDNGKDLIRAFDVDGDGAVSNDRIFCGIPAGGLDGMRADEDGRLWVTSGDGVTVVAPDGAILGSIGFPEKPANCTFGGPDGQTLFVTARTGLYAIEVKVKGAPSPARRPTK